MLECAVHHVDEAAFLPPPGRPRGRMLEIAYVAVRLRLKRMGRRHRSFYRISAMDSRTPRDGRVIEELGWYDPNAAEPERQLSLDRQRIEHWLSVGAQPSDTVRNLLKQQGIAVKG
jgi:small subunit ribosomal protein S16